MADPYDALLIVSYGGPENPDDVVPFLENVALGKNVPRQRILEVAQHYYLFGGESPLNGQLRALLASLIGRLNTDGPLLPVYWANCYWHPLLVDTLQEMADQIEALENRGYDVTKLSVAFHGKIARTFSPLVMVLIGLPFAFKVGRRGSLYGVGVALLLVLVYWAALALFNALGLETLAQPIVAAWAPNILFGLLGVTLLLYVRT